jgi:hypothetical protein
MDAMDELDRLALGPAVKAQLSALMSSLLQQNSEQLAEKNSLLEQSAKIIAEKDTKIAALTHELAYCKRIRFGQKTEALAEKCSCIFCIHHLPVACGPPARPVPGRGGDRPGGHRSGAGTAQGGAEANRRGAAFLPQWAAAVTQPPASH